MSNLAGHTRELEVLIARSARRGWLDLRDLVDTYTQLAPTNHRLLANPRKVDIDALLLSATRANHRIAEVSPAPPKPQDRTDRPLYPCAHRA